MNIRHFQQVFHPSIQTFTLNPSKIILNDNEVL